MENEAFGQIYERDVCEAIANAEIVKEYPDDKPYSSCLILGWRKNNKPLHIVCAYAPEDERCIVITVYEPYPKLWIEYREKVR